MGPNRARALAQALKVTDAHKVNLTYNRLDPGTGKMLMESINPQITDLNLEKNSLGVNNVFVDALVKHLDRHDNCLQSLNLSQNRVTDKHVESIVNILTETKNDCLKKLKLAKNRLTCDAAFALRDLYKLYNGAVLENLDLSNNKIYLPGALAIAEIVKKDPITLRVIDLSWNLVSKAPPKNAKEEE